MHLDENQVKRLAFQIQRGQVILFTGAGFSMAAQAVDGQPLPSVDDLRKTIWPIAFPDDPIDSESRLSEVFSVALDKHPVLLRDTLNGCLRVDREAIPELYRLWFGMPWLRHYTVNIDDLDESAQGSFGFPRVITSVSALTDDLPSSFGLLSVHLNGRLDDFPNLTFSEAQYGERTALGDPWYQFLVGDLISRPVLFVGTQLDEPPLWHYLALRKRRGSGAELRPRSLLVTPSLGPARREMLKGLNVDWVAMSQEDFAETYLSAMTAEKELGLQHLHDAARAGQEILLDVADLRLRRVDDPAEFLLGREPTWGDVTTGFAVERDFESDLPQRIDDSGAGVVVLTGTAGSGKSTTLLRLALKYESQGKRVAVLNHSAFTSLGRIRGAVSAVAPDVLVVDDADLFSAAAGEFLLDMASAGPDLLVLAAMRSTKYESLEVGSLLVASGGFQFTIPNLEDSDIDRLLDSLDEANRLGVLAGMSRPQQTEVFRGKAGRQLLVAMYEATTGWRFEDKISQECSELSPELARVYAIITAATSLRQYLTRDEVLAAYGDFSNDASNLVRRLVNQRLVLETGDELRVRHRVIADQALNHFIEQRAMEDAVLGLMFAMASRVSPSGPRRSRFWTILIPLLSHDLLVRWLDGDVSAIRNAYEHVEELLNWHPHYWLQRGRFEAEHGDTSLAHNFLGQAYSLNSNDSRIAAAWAGIEIRLAAENPNRGDAFERVETALDLLDEAIEERGEDDSYPFHILGSQGLSWARSAPMPIEDRKALYARLLYTVRAGVKLHPKSADLRQLEEDIQKDYLLLAVPPGSS